MIGLVISRTSGVGKRVNELLTTVLFPMSGRSGYSHTEPCAGDAVPGRTVSRLAYNQQFSKRNC